MDSKRGKTSELQTIDFRIRVRVTAPKSMSAKDLLDNLAESILGLEGVVGLKEHSWTRHKTPTIPSDTKANV